MITSPGLYRISNTEYHRDPVEGGSLNCSGAKLLTPPNPPAKFFHHQQNPPSTTPEMIFGSAIHHIVLENSQDLEICDYKTWSSKAASEHYKKAVADNKTPILNDDYDHALGMLEALKQHPIAANLLWGTEGENELAIVWQQEQAWLRCKMDRICEDSNGNAKIIDYKTTRNSSPEEISKTIFRYGYHQQQAWYLQGAEALANWNNADFTFIFQEKCPPYLITVVSLHPSAVQLGNELNQAAIKTWLECKETDVWPGNPIEVLEVGLPRWMSPAILEY